MSSSQLAQGYDNGLVVNQGTLAPLHISYHLLFSNIHNTLYRNGILYISHSGITLSSHCIFVVVVGPSLPNKYLRSERFSALLVLQLACLPAGALSPLCS